MSPYELSTRPGVLFHTEWGTAIWVTLSTVPGRQVWIDTLGAVNLYLTFVNVEENGDGVIADDPEVGLRASLALRRLAERVEAESCRRRPRSGLVLAANR